eukprot:1073323-Amphidinium_carterae.1
MSEFDLARCSCRPKTIEETVSHSNMHGPALETHATRLACFNEAWLVAAPSDIYCLPNSTTM